MLKPLLEDWRREPGLSVAADLVSAAYSIGITDPVRDAAEYVLAQRNSTPAAREIAQQCIVCNDGLPTRVSAQTFAPPHFRHVRHPIHTARKRLVEYPLNPVLWADLSRLYVTIGNTRKAERAMDVALSLAPDNRFIVRAASRLHLHQADFERAHSVLLRSPLLLQDPWILAGELAMACIRGRPSRNVRRARQILDSRGFGPFQVSELNGTDFFVTRDGVLI